MGVLWRSLKEYKGLLFLSLLLAAINQVFSLLDPLIFRIIVDNYAVKYAELSKDAFIKGVLLLLTAAVGVTFISRVAKNFQDYYVSMISQRVATKQYSDAIAHSLSLPYGVFEDQKSGEILQKIQKAKQDMQIIIGSIINNVFISIVGMLFVMVYAFYTHWIIGMVFILSMPIIGVTAYFVSKGIKKAQKEILAESTGLAGTTTETLRNIELVKSLGLENQEIKRLNRSNDKILALELRKIRKVRTLSFIQGTMINLTRSAILFIMLWLIFEGYITIGSFFTLMIYSFFIFGPLAEFGNTISQYQEAKASYEQLQDIMRMQVQKKPKNAKKISSIQMIRFDNVSFKYPLGNDHSLNGVNLEFKRGETIGIAGLSGSGKSTIIKMLSGLYSPTEGKILINNIDSKKIDLEHYKKKIGIVSQETQLFAGTVRENLLFANPDATDKECIDALNMASALNIIERDKKGLDTRIGEGGVKISGGERQRLAIARALLRNPEIIIFDEATSNLDSVTEKIIIRTIKLIKKKRPDMIIVMVAHRLSTIAHSDKIYVLNNGKVVERGTHNLLIIRNGLYSRLWREQVRK
ncbi:TPA: ABC transporter ATP-binding protein [bacterium]|nr:ABC transporter ATP-binding protein [bacterium]